jgi:hypothetical protein
MTGIPITAGVKVAVFITDGQLHDDIQFEYIKGLPIFGEYDEYGSIENVEDTFSYRHLKRLFGEDFLKDDFECPHDNQSMVIRPVYEKFALMPTGDELKMMRVMNKVRSTQEFVLRLPRVMWKDKWDAFGDFDTVLKELPFSVQARTEEEQEWYEKNRYKISCPNLEYWMETRRYDLYQYPEEDYFEAVCRYMTFVTAMIAARKTFNNLYLGCQHEKIKTHLELNEITQQLLKERYDYMIENDFDW